MSVHFNETFLTEFFELYKENECLWKVKSPEYHDRNLKKRAINILVNKFKEVHEDATEDFVKKKLNNFRTSYKRELKLVKESCHSGAGADEVYKPKLWYFHLLSFLDDQEVVRASMDNISSDAEVSK